MTDQFYLCSSPTVGAVLVLGWVIAQRIRRYRHMRQRYDASRLPATTPMASMEPALLPSPSPRGSAAAASSVSPATASNNVPSSCIGGVLSPSTTGGVTIKCNGATIAHAPTNNVSASPSPSHTTAAATVVAATTGTVHDNNHDHDSTSSSPTHSATIAATVIPSLPSRTVSESSSDADH
jgi:hypothetical protein